MCGIAGIIYSDHTASMAVMEKMLDSMHHRGPDDRGTARSGDTLLGHTRLAIIDVENGKQPIVSEDSRFILVFNGEIYNYIELRQKLVLKGHSFRTNSDTEVLLHMYIEYGKNCLDHLNGMFAFAIYDTVEEELFLARDHFGIKPLYYSCIDGLFIFASEIKAILKHPKIKSEPDSRSIHEYITFQLVLKKHTLFNNIHKLEPATLMFVRNGKIANKERYWNIDYTIDDSRPQQQIENELLILLESSVALQLRSDVPVGSYLSGGLDSSIITTLAAKNYGADFTTFSGGFKLSKAYDETAYAKIVSDSVKSKHCVIYPESQDFIDCFEKILWHMDEPAAGPGIFPQFMVSKMAADQVKVILGGQGGDEIFGGYARYAVAYLEQCLKGSIFETQEEGKHIVTLGSIISNLSLLKQYVPMIRSQFSDGLFEGMDRRYFKLVNRSQGAGRIFSDDFMAMHDNESLFDKFLQIFDHPETKSYFNKMTHFDTVTLLQGLLHVEDRVSMAVSLESRVPFLDKRIVEHAAKIPPPLKFAGGKTKYILMQAVKNVLPYEIINRKDKMGFPTPINEWLSGPLKGFFLDILTDNRARNRGIYNIAGLEKELNSQQKFSRDLWGALNLELWHRIFIDADSPYRT